ncbi:MAG: glycosyltransferase family 2 protein [Candidatus Omnitrophica bacterium]|nr:glycosyltransferase family 2 protein [Candidatus Omnitrophota bacterium]
MSPNVMSNSATRLVALLFTQVFLVTSITPGWAQMRESACIPPSVNIPVMGQDAGPAMQRMIQVMEAAASTAEPIQWSRRIDNAPVMAEAFRKALLTAFDRHGSGELIPLEDVLKDLLEWDLQCLLPEINSAAIPRAICAAHHYLNADVRKAFDIRLQHLAPHDYAGHRRYVKDLRLSLLRQMALGDGIRSAKAKTMLSDQLLEMGILRPDEVPAFGKSLSGNWPAVWSKWIKGQAILVKGIPVRYDVLSGRIVVENSFDLRSFSAELFSLNAPPKIVITTLNWNGGKETEKLLRSLEQLEYPYVELVILDNGSTEDKFYETHKASLLEKFPNLCATHLLRSDTNLGFDEGHNVAAEFGCDVLVAEAIWCLNNDAAVQPGALAALVRVLQEGAEDVPADDIGVLGSVIVSLEKPDEILNAGSRFLGSTWLKRPGIRTIDPSQPAMTVDTVSGAAILIREKVWHGIGGWPGHFFAYAEESFLGGKLQDAGLCTVLVSDSRVQHTRGGGSTGGPSSPFVLRNSARNHIAVVRSFGGVSLKWLFQYSAINAVRVLRGIRSGKPRASWAVLQGMTDGVRGIDHRLPVPNVQGVSYVSGKAYRRTEEQKAAGLVASGYMAAFSSGSQREAANKEMGVRARMGAQREYEAGGDHAEAVRAKLSGWTASGSVTEKESQILEVLARSLDRREVRLFISPQSNLGPNPGQLATACSIPREGGGLDIYLASNLSEEVQLEALFEEIFENLELLPGAVFEGMSRVPPMNWSHSLASSFARLSHDPTRGLPSDSFELRLQALVRAKDLATLFQLYGESRQWLEDHVRRNDIPSEKEDAETYVRIKALVETTGSRIGEAYEQVRREVYAERLRDLRIPGILMPSDIVRDVMQAATSGDGVRYALLKTEILEWANYLVQHQYMLLQEDYAVAVVNPQEAALHATAFVQTFEATLSQSVALKVMEDRAVNAILTKRWKDLEFVTAQVSEAFEKIQRSGQGLDAPDNPFDYSSRQLKALAGVYWDWQQNVELASLAAQLFDRAFQEGSPLIHPGVRQILGELGVHDVLKQDSIILLILKWIDIAGQNQDHPDVSRARFAAVALAELEQQDWFTQRADRQQLMQDMGFEDVADLADLEGLAGNVRASMSPGDQDEIPGERFFRTLRLVNSLFPLGGASQPLFSEGAFDQMQTNYVYSDSGKARIVREALLWINEVQFLMTEASVDPNTGENIAAALDHEYERFLHSDSGAFFDQVGKIRVLSAVDFLKEVGEELEHRDFERGDLAVAAANILLFGQEAVKRDPVVAFLRKHGVVNTDLLGTIIAYAHQLRMRKDLVVMLWERFDLMNQGIEAAILGAHAQDVATILDILENSANAAGAITRLNAMEIKTAGPKRIGMTVVVQRLVKQLRAGEDSGGQGYRNYNASDTLLEQANTAGILELGL